MLGWQKNPKEIGLSLLENFLLVLKYLKEPTETPPSKNVYATVSVVFAISFWLALVSIQTGFEVGELVLAQNTAFVLTLSIIGMCIGYVLSRFPGKTSMHILVQYTISYFIIYSLLVTVFFCAFQFKIGGDINFKIARYVEMPFILQLFFIAGVALLLLMFIRSAGAKNAFAMPRIYRVWVILIAIVAPFSVQAAAMTSSVVAA